MRRPLSRIVRLLTPMALLGAQVCGSAATITAAFQVTAIYQNSCQLNTVPSLDFGTVFSGMTSMEVSSRVDVSCSTGVPFGVWAPLSANATGSQRRVKNTASANYINYNVYAGVSVTTLPTSATSTGFTSSVTGSTVPLRAVIPNGQAMLPGSYSDTLVITVNY